MGVQLADRMILSASKKFLNKLATSKSCLKSFWNSSIMVKKREKKFLID